MEPQEATCVIPDGRQVKVSHPTQPATDDTGHSAVENSQTTTDVVQNKAPSKRSDATEPATKDKSRPKSKKPAKHRQQRSKAVKNVMVAVSDDDDDDSSSSEEDDDDDEEDGVSEDDSSTDSDCDDKKTRSRKKGTKKSSKISKVKHGNKKRTKHRSSKNAAKDSSSSSSDESDDSDDSDAQDKKVKSRSSGNGELDQGLAQQLSTLQLQVSQLQQHLSKSNPLAAMNTGFPIYGSNNVPFGGIGLQGGLAGLSGLPGGLGGNVSSGLGGNLGAIANPGGDNSGLNSLPQILPPPGPPRRRGRRGFQTRPPSDLKDPYFSDDQSSKNGKNEKSKPGSRPEFKRVDWVWDTNLYTFKLQDTAETSNDSQYSEYIFHVRRTFDCENKYRETYVDIKSKLLRECLQDVIGNVQGVSLVDETPKMDPNLLFL